MMFTMRMYALNLFGMKIMVILQVGPHCLDLMRMKTSLDLFGIMMVIRFLRGVVVLAPSKVPIGLGFEGTNEVDIDLFEPLTPNRKTVMFSLVLTPHPLDNGF